MMPDSGEPDPPSETLGKRVRRLRGLQGWTQDTLAEKAKLSKSFISEIENDAAHPRGPILVRLANALGASLDYLMTGRNAEPTHPASVKIPAELASVADRRGLPYRHVALLLDFYKSIEARRRDQGDRNLSEAEWEEFYESVLPHIKKLLHQENV